MREAALAWKARGAVLYNLVFGRSWGFMFNTRAVEIAATREVYTKR